MVLLARHYAHGDCVKIEVGAGLITSMDVVHSSPSEALPWVAPGLFDLQINGYGGVWFSDEQLTSSQVLQVLQAHFAHGITRMCPTLITNSQAALLHGFHAIRQACEQEPWANAMVAGCHLEGPHISTEDGPRGAHPLQHVRDCSIPEFEQLQEASGHRIRLVTLAPESPGAVEYIRHLVAQRVTVSIGHTAAESSHISAAVTAGARLSTHLGNGAHGVIRRHPNYIWDQLGEPQLWASVISDGHHLPASVLKSILFAKGPRKLIITCDASGLAGSAPGVYQYQGASFEVLPEGKVVIAGQRQYLAGSALQTEACVANMIKLTGVTLEQAWEMASSNPARLLQQWIPELRVGAPADLVLFHHDQQAGEIQVSLTLVGGKTVFER